MATLIPSIRTCASRMTSGERRVARRLEDKLDDDYLLWYDVPMGPKGIPLVKPVSCGRNGHAPILIKLPTLREETLGIADQLNQAHKEGHARGDIPLLSHDYTARDRCSQVLHQRQMPVDMRHSPSDFDPTSDTIKAKTMKASKGLEFPVVAQPEVQPMQVGSTQAQRATA